MNQEVEHDVVEANDDLVDPTRLRIDDLARRTGLSVRNIREYQDRGLIPAPEREGRIAWYGDQHVVRLELIDRLLRRGYTLAVIRDLVDAWADGRDLRDVLGFEEVVSAPWTQDAPIVLTAQDVVEALGPDNAQPVIDAAVSLGLVERHGEADYLLNGRQLLVAAADVLEAGVERDVLLERLAGVVEDLERASDRLVGMIYDQLFPGDAEVALPTGPHVRLVTETIEALRPHATAVLQSVLPVALARSMDRHFARLAERSVPAPGAAEAAHGG